MKEGDKTHIVRIHMTSSNVYVVKSGGKAILIDTGMKKKEKKIIAALQRINVSPRDIKLIILTHTHYDHCGSLKALKDITKAKILVHKAEAECLKEGYCDLPKGTMWFSKAMAAIGRTLAKKMAEYDAVDPDITISRRFDLHPYGIDGYVLPTPGHTAGSISIIIDEKHAIVGDTLFHIVKHSVFPPYANDQKTLLSSWEKLLAVGCEYFYPGHGKPFMRAKFEKTYEKRSNKILAAVS
ncbi:MAG: MBL fold metallo-hydrolase [Deltaproteobacteria bacterium]|nr:MBL fold metallo-hydrolase [Deltaproteobacteria bacterium]